MERTEDILPPRLAFDATLGDTECREIVEMDIVAAREDGDGLIGYDFELAHTLDGTIRELSEVISRVLMRPEEKPEQAVDAIYRAIMLAMQTVSRAAPQGVRGISLHDYLPGSGNVGDVADKIIDDTQHYLSTRPHVDGFIGSYMPEIDRTGLYAHVAETAAALIMMLCERAVADQYIGDINWDDAAIKHGL